MGRVAPDGGIARFPASDTPCRSIHHAAVVHQAELPECHSGGVGSSPTCRSHTGCSGAEQRRARRSHKPENLRVIAWVRVPLPPQRAFGWMPNLRQKIKWRITRLPIWRSGFDSRLPVSMGWPELRGGIAQSGQSAALIMQGSLVQVQVSPQHGGMPESGRKGLSVKQYKDTSVVQIHLPPPQPHPSQRARED